MKTFFTPDSKIRQVHFIRNAGGSSRTDRFTAFYPFFAILAILFFINLPLSASDIETYYGPSDRLAERVINLYDQAEKTIYIACFNITYRPIVKALVRAKRRGVDVRVITDHGQTENNNTHRAVSSLLEAGIPVKINRHDGLMHIKQAVIDGRVNTSGSFNQTWSANKINDERLDIIQDPENSKKAREKFLSMWKDSERFGDLAPGF